MFRFTLGIPGVDDAVIPRVVGLAGAALLWANHAFSVAPSAAQDRAEWLGVLLCAASVVVPSLDERLNEVRVRPTLDLCCTLLHTDGVVLVAQQCWALLHTPAKHAQQTPLGTPPRTPSWGAQPSAYRQRGRQYACSVALCC